MIKTQIYLTETERAKLADLCIRTGKNQSELIREAIDQLIEHSSQERCKKILKAAAGIWRDRKDLLNFGTSRSEWDRI